MALIKVLLGCVFFHLGKRYIYIKYKDYAKLFVSLFNGISTFVRYLIPK